MSDINKSVSYSVDADSSGFQQGMAAAASSADKHNSAIAKGFEQIQDTMSKLQSAFKELSKIIQVGSAAGVKAMEDMADKTEDSASTTQTAMPQAAKYNHRASRLVYFHTFRCMKKRTPRGNSRRPSHTPHDTHPEVASKRFRRNVFTTVAATLSGNCAPSKFR